MRQFASTRTFPHIVVFVLIAASCVGESRGGELKVDGRTIKVPEGFTIDRIAGPPLVNRPITAAFDDQGRLYVADSSGSNDNVQKQLKEKPHRIVRLEDSDGDGTFDKQTVFADKMMFPEGTMWLGGSLYVAAPPSIWKLTDTNGDGVADTRVEWFQGKTLTGCANDLHGPYPGLDGWIYWCKGAFAKQTYSGAGSQFTTRAAHIFRSPPDGGFVEPVMTGGMDNPVDVVFTPGGERIFTTTFFVHPGGGQRDGLIHAIYGGIYGKVHDPLLEPPHPWTGPDVMPVLLHMGPAAPCGLTRYESTALGTDFQDNLFACYFNLHKISRHVLTPHGATFTTQDQDFVTSPDLDFHPTDVIEDAAGSLVLVDTGGWYKLCCPTSQLQKPDVLGAVYRVRRQGSRPQDDPWGKGLRERENDLDSAAKVKDFIALLGDPRPAVRRKAIEILAAPSRKELVLSALGDIALKDLSLEVRRNIVWTLARIDAPAAREQVRRLLSDVDETVVQAAIHTAGLRRDRMAVSRLMELLEAPSMHNRRAAAEALGRIGDNAAVPALLAASGQPADRVLEHSLTYALIQIADLERSKAGLNTKNNHVLRAAMVALDQRKSSALDPRFVAGLLDSSDPIIKETASWIAGRHTEWAGALAGALDQRLVRVDLSTTERAELERQLGRFAQSAAVQDLLAARLRDPSAPLAARRSSLQAMAWSGLNEKQVPARWLTALASVLDGSPSHADLVPVAVATVRSLPLARGQGGELTARLLQIAAADNTDELRLNALAAIAGGLKDPDEKTLTFLLAKLHGDQTVAARTTAADVLARAQLTTQQLARLAGELRSAGPVEADRLLAAFEQSTDETLGLELVKVLGESSGFASLRPDALKSHLAKFGPAVQKQAEGLLLRLNVDAAKQKARLEQLVPTLSTGDIRRGQVVFHSEKAACFSCHAIGYRGGTVGPDLTKIGSVRSANELLEAIVFPSSSLVRSFEPITVATTNGKFVNGLLRGETADEIRLATGVNQETRIARREIEEIRPSAISIMPAGLDQQLTHQELADLVAFLKACN
jgi:putative membrane-bound dehydrogenase-like protein